MTRQSKQGERRARCPKKNKFPAQKTGPKKDNLPKGYKAHTSSLSSQTAYIPKI